MSLITADVYFSCRPSADVKIARGKERKKELMYRVTTTALDQIGNIFKRQFLSVVSLDLQDYFKRKISMRY